MSQWSFEDTNSPNSENETLPFTWEIKNNNRQLMMHQLKVLPQHTSIVANAVIEQKTSSTSIET